MEVNTSVPNGVAAKDHVDRPIRPDAERPTLASLFGSKRSGHERKHKVVSGQRHKGALAWLRWLRIWRSVSCVGRSVTKDHRLLAHVSVERKNGGRQRVWQREIQTTTGARHEPCSTFHRRNTRLCKSTLPRAFLPWPSARSASGGANTTVAAQDQRAIPGLLAMAATGDLLVRDHRCDGACRPPFSFLHGLALLGADSALELSVRAARQRRHPPTSRDHAGALSGRNLGRLCLQLPARSDREP